MQPRSLSNAEGKTVFEINSYQKRSIHFNTNTHEIRTRDDEKKRIKSECRKIVKRDGFIQ